jgi:hypothetical protein
MCENLIPGNTERSKDIIFEFDLKHRSNDHPAGARERAKTIGILQRVMRVVDNRRRMRSISVSTRGVRIGVIARVIA